MDVSLSQVQCMCPIAVLFRGDLPGGVGRLCVFLLCEAPECHHGLYKNGKFAIRVKKHCEEQH